MKNTLHSPNCHPHSGALLSDGHPLPDLNAVPLAIRKLAQRLGISIEYAMTVAHLAGIGGSEMC